MEKVLEINCENVKLYNHLHSNIVKIYQICKKENKEQKLLNDIKKITDYLDNIGDSLYYLEIKINNEKETILKNLTCKNLKPLENLDISLKNDIKFIKKAIMINPEAFKYASRELKNDKDFILEIIREKPNILDFLNEEYKNNKNIVEEAVKKDGWSILYASEEMRNNKEIASLAVKNSYTSMQCLNAKLCDDADIVKIACDGEDKEVMMEYASQNLKQNSQFFEDMMEINPLTLEYFCEEFKDQEDKILLAIFCDYRNFRYASDRLKSEKDFIIKVIELIDNHSNFIYNTIDEKLKKDIEIILRIANNGSYIDISREIKDKILDIFN